MIPWLLVMELVSTTGKSLSELVGIVLKPIHHEIEINSKLVDAKSAIERVRVAYEKEAVSVDETDGISIGIQIGVLIYAVQIRSRLFV